MLGQQQNVNDAVSDIASDIENAPLVQNNIDSDENVEYCNTESLKRKYDEILNRTTNKVYIVLLLTLAEPLLTSSRYPFMVLYIQSFSSNTTTEQISILVFAGMSYYSFSTLIYTSLGDKFGHDKMLIIALFFISAGLFLESITNSLWIFIIGYFVNKIPNIPVAFAYIPRILPHKYSVRYCSILWTICAVIYLLGPMVGALIAQYATYRTIWILNFVVHVVFFVISFMTLKGSISDLEKQQSVLQILPFLEEDEQFPVCIKNKKTKNAANHSTNGQQRNMNENWFSNYINFWRALPRFELWMLLYSIFMNNAVWAIEALVIFYYVIFMLNRFGSDIMYNTLMLVELTVIYGVTNLMVPRLIKRIIPSYIWLITLCSTLLTFVCVLCSMRINKFVYYWGYDILIAILFGIISMSSEMCILEMQPKQHTGKVTGFKGCIKYIFRGTSTMLVGLFWESPYYSSLWYGVGALSVMVLSLSIPMLIFAWIYKK